MRLRIHHTTTYAYEHPASYAIQVLRLSPGDHKGQYVCDWRLEINADCKLDAIRDPFGNQTHSFSVDGPIDTLVISAVGEVETNDTNGLISGTRERLPLALYLRETALTEPDEHIKTFAADYMSGHATDRLEKLHLLNTAVHKTLRFDTRATESTTTAVEAFAHKHGVCQDLAHVFIAACRHLEVPARYVGGYMFRSDGENEQEAGHAWAEAWVEGLGWVGFDPAHGLAPTDAYVRVAVGLDSLDATPIRGTRYGGLGEDMSVVVSIEDLNAERVES
ncbi:MAG: transglutaminase family protein [Pseudomonadota bacterium]